MLSSLKLTATNSSTVSRRISFSEPSELAFQEIKSILHPDSPPDVRLKHIDKLNSYLQNYTLISKLLRLRLKLRELYSKAYVLDYEPGALIYSNNPQQPAGSNSNNSDRVSTRSFNLVLHGTVNIYCSVPSQDTLMLARKIKTNQHFGQSAEYDGNPFSQAVACMQDKVVVLVLDLPTTYKIFQGILVLPEVTSLCEYYRSIQLFYNLDKRSLLKLVAKSVKQSMTIGNFLFRQGEQPSKIVVIIAGEVCLMKQAADNLVSQSRSSKMQRAMRPICSVSSKEVLGLEEILNNQAYKLSAKCVTQTVSYYQINKDTVAQVLAPTPSTVQIKEPTLSSPSKIAAVTEPAEFSSPQRITQVKQHLRQTRQQRVSDVLAKIQKLANAVSMRKCSYREKQKFYNEVKKNDANNLPLECFALGNGTVPSTHREIFKKSHKTIQTNPPNVNTNSPPTLASQRRRITTTASSLSSSRRKSDSINEERHSSSGGRSAYLSNKKPEPEDYTSEESFYQNRILKFQKLIVQKYGNQYSTAFFNIFEDFYINKKDKKYNLKESKASYFRDSVIESTGKKVKTTMLDSAVLSSPKYSAGGSSKKGRTRSGNQYYSALGHRTRQFSEESINRIKRKILKGGNEKDRRISDVLMTRERGTLQTQPVSRQRLYTDG